MFGKESSFTKLGDSPFEESEWKRAGAILFVAALIYFLPRTVGFKPIDGADAALLLVVAVRHFRVRKELAVARKKEMPQRWWKGVGKKAFRLVLLAWVLILFLASLVRFSIGDYRGAAVFAVVAALWAFVAQRNLHERAELERLSLARREGRANEEALWLKVIGIVWFACALVCIPEGIRLAVEKSVGELGFFNLTINAPFGLWLSGRQFRLLTMKIFAPTAEEVMVADSRPVVLYLRSFRDDPVATKSPDIDFFSEEIALAEVMSSIGPLVAIGRPGEPLPELGAARTYVSDAEWQDKILGLMSKARLVVLRAGNTPGFWWELERAVKNLPPERLLFLLPFRKNMEYEAFRQEAQKHLSAALPDYPKSSWQGGEPAPTSVKAVLYFDPDWTPHLELLRGNWKVGSRGRQFVLAMQEILNPMAQNLRIAWEKPKKPPASRFYRFVFVPTVSVFLVLLSSVVAGRHPVLLRIGDVTMHTYGFLVATGMLVALWLVRAHAHQAGLDPDRLGLPVGGKEPGDEGDITLNLGSCMTLAALVGSKVWFIGQYWQYYSKYPREILTLSMLKSAGVFYGGLITAIVVAFFYARRAKLGFLALADVYAAPLALGHAIGRMGCFSAGCCWGRETTVAWGVTVTDPYAGQLIGVPLGIKLHPTQLYEGLALVVIFAVLMWLVKRQKFTGQIFAAYAVLYGITRGIVEAFRGDPSRPMVFGGALSLNQVVSIGLVLMGALLWWWGARRTAAGVERHRALGND